MITGNVIGSVTEDVSPTVSGTLSVADIDTGEAKFQTPASLSGAYGSFTSMLQPVLGPIRWTTVPRR